MEAMLRRMEIPAEPPEEPESKRLTPLERHELIQRACQMLPDWKANTSAIARELGVNRKILERSPLYRRARAIECSINPDDYRD
jgi:transposase-like protein